MLAVVLTLSKRGRRVGTTAGRRRDVEAKSLVSRKQVEGNGLRGGYFGASVALILWLLDQCIVYATWI
jgi:hypothetical protein